MDDAEFAALQVAMLADPEAGDVVSGSGGCRKLRWRAPGRGKRGGYRVIYFLRNAEGLLCWRCYIPRTCATTLSPDCFAN